MIPLKGMASADTSKGHIAGHRRTGFSGIMANTTGGYHTTSESGKKESLEVDRLTEQDNILALSTTAAAAADLTI